MYLKLNSINNVIEILCIHCFKFLSERIEADVDDSMSRPKSWRQIELVTTIQKYTNIHTHVVAQLAEQSFPILIAFVDITGLWGPLKHL